MWNTPHGKSTMSKAKQTTNKNPMPYDTLQVGQGM